MVLGVAFLVVLLAAAVAYLMVTRLAPRPESGVPLGLFRIAYGCVLFGEVAQMLYYAPLITDPVAFLVPGEIQLTYLLSAWLAALVFLTLGLFTRSAAVVSYVAGLATFSVFREFEYHVDYVFTGVNALMVIAPVERRLSLDGLRLRLAAAANGQPEPSAEVSAIYRKLFVLVGIALVYFDSMLWKVASPMWTQGLGVWTPASQPQMVWYDYSFLLDREWLAKGLGYITLVVETSFIVLMWFDAAAIPLAIVGAGLHLGITAVFPIPWFGLAEAAVYLLVLPVGLYRQLGEKVRAAGPRLTVFYDDTCTACARARIAIEHFDARHMIEFRRCREGRPPHPALVDIPLATLHSEIYSVDADKGVHHGWETYRRVAARLWPFAPLAWLVATPGLHQVMTWGYRALNDRWQPHAVTATGERCDGEASDDGTPAPWVPPSWARRSGLGLLITAIVALQAAASTQSPLVRQLVGHPFDATLASAGRRVTTAFGQPLLGLQTHPVFMDSIHFKGYNHIVAIVYDDPVAGAVWLPVIRPSGLAHWMNSGRLWVFWTFRAMSPRVNPARLNLGIKRLTAFWMHRNGISERDATFRILVKRVEAPKSWEYGFLHRQKEQPWREAGVATWKSGVFKTAIKNIEAVR